MDKIVFRCNKAKIVAIVRNISEKYGYEEDESGREGIREMEHCEQHCELAVTQ